ncbi:hypothetical protein SERLA73DRAFT_183234 [Serpula lacrymans var. lacrymans S7.3]|uniref:Zinc-finger domain-containing protein n=2 Tax=Serpula lacrymans var. lacrymans TaxID=341189 RepID=F8PZH9_SERL3|nr:uncharacterized protein SERLADRAFT_470280 [Serpula lacrymans var. lacrymans S7.9]EGN98301.1 hypothetical protein SERLA73DRAFT_183234 [Serpula lacrymans var. lacrymans S7.3]EGO23867.1 hypothetical protein SERLADRAFT_470280 [Serpula lacrymans var. lacrymans S7.9]
MLERYSILFFVFEFVDDADAARAAWTSRVVEGATGAQGLTLETYSTQAVTHTQHPLHPSAVQGQQVDAADEVGASSAQIFHVSQRKEQESNSNSAMAFTTYRSPFTVYPLLLSQSSSAISSDDPSSLHKDFSSQAGLAQSENSESHSLSLYHRISTITPSVPSPSSQASSSSSTYSSSSSHISLPRVSLPDFQQLKQATLQLVLSQLTAGDTSRRVCQYEVPGGGVCRDQTCEDVHLSRIAGSSVGTMAIDVEPTDFDTATYVHDGLPPIWRARCNTKDIENALDAVRRRGSMKGFEARVREALVLLGIPVSSGTPTAT